MTNDHLAVAEHIMKLAEEAGTMPAHVHGGILAQVQAQATMALAEEAGRIATALETLAERDSFA